MVFLICRVFLLICLSPWFVFSYVRIPKANLIPHKQIRQFQDANSFTFVNKDDNEEDASNEEDANNYESVENEGGDVEMQKVVKPIHYLLEYNIDVEQEKLGGTVQIDLECESPTYFISLNTRELDIDLTSVSIHLKDSSENLLILSKNLIAENDAFEIYLENELLIGKVYTLKLDFEKTSESAIVFFKKYEDENRTKKKIAVVQCNDASAMDLFPCFEGYGVMATFDLIVVRPKNLRSAAAMEIIKQEPRSGNRMADIYSRTPRMNANNINIIVSDYGFTEQLTSQGVKIRVWAPKFKLGSTKFAANISANALERLETYFDSPLPYKKLDIFQIPDLPAAGVANLGLVMCAAEVIFIDAKTKLEDKKHSANILTHEIGHQWFGVMIEPSDAENYWINEAFANFVSNEIMEKLSPEWKVEESFILNQMHEGLKEDSTFFSHPLTVPSSMNSEEDVNDLPIAYYKGSCVFRTLKSGMGEIAFVKGIQIFVKKFLYSGASADNIWEALSKAAIGTEASGQDFRKIARSWTFQMGYPVIKINQDYGKKITTATQHHFIDPASPFGVNNRFSDIGYKWSVPITYVTSKELNWNNPKRIWLNESSHVYNDMPRDNNEWIIANVNSGGFYRVNYDAANWKMLLEQMNKDYSKITPINRAALFDDAFNLANFGFLNINTALDLTTNIDKEEDFLPFETLIDNLQLVHDKFADAKMRGYMQKYFIPKLIHKYKSINWESADMEVLSSTKREKLFKFLCDLKLDDCVKTTTNKFKSFMKNIRAHRTMQLKSLKLCYGLKYGSRKEWNEAYYETAMDNALLPALACTKDPQDIQLLLDGITQGEIAKTEHFNVMSQLAKNPAASKLVFTYLINNWEVLLDSKSGNDFMTKLSDFVQNLSTAEDLKQLKTLEKKPRWRKWKENAYKKSVDALTSNIQWVKFNKAAAQNWLNSAVKG